MTNYLTLQSNWHTLNNSINNAKNSEERKLLIAERNKVQKEMNNMTNDINNAPSIYSESEQLANNFPTKGVVATAEGIVAAKQLKVVTDTKVIGNSELYNPKTNQAGFNSKFGYTEGNTKFVEDIKNAKTPQGRLEAIAQHAKDPNTNIAKEAQNVLDDITKKGLENKPTQLVSKLDDAANAGKATTSLGKNIGKAYTSSGGIYTKGNVLLTVAGGAVDAGISMYSDYQENGTLTKEGSGKPAVKAACATGAAVAGLGVGAAVGAKVGAALGTVACPGLGTAAGIAVGAAIGAGCYYVGGLVGDLINGWW